MADKEKLEGKGKQGFKKFNARISKWVREMRSELKKVVWPTKEQLLKSTGVVIVCCFVVGAFIWVFDFAASLFVQGLISLAS